METASETLTLPEKTVSQIRALSLIARANGSLVTLKDITSLTSVDTSPEQLEAAWPTIPELSSNYLLGNGLMMRVGHGQGEEQAEFARELDRRARAAVFVKHARDFSSFSKGKGASLLAISGSTSYQSVSESDDLDFFCVTQPSSLWIFLSKSLLLARFFGLVRKRAPRICFSYAVDEDFAAREFSLASDALFARDALTTIVIHGREYYRELLRESSWMSKYFPRAYGQKTAPTFREQTGGRRTPSSTRRKFLNLLLWSLVGRYIAFKSTMLNWKFRKQGRPSSLFKPRIGPDHCIFESIRYSSLRAMYRGLESELSSASQQPTPRMGA